VNFTNIVDKAIQRRKKLTAVTNAMRLVNGRGDGLDGLLIDCYDRHLHIQLLSDHWHSQRDEIVRLLTARLPVDYLIVKSRRGLEIKDDVLIGAEGKTLVDEHGLKFEVDLNDGLNCGLFLDMRANRRLISQAAKGKKVLNCFAYTCSFGVHACAGGARDVVNTDISRKVLDRGRYNYDLNALPAGPGAFIKTDSMAFLQRAFKKGNSFDIVVLDPPSFARHEGKNFQVKRDLPKLLALAVAVLNPGGQLLVATNFSELAHADLERILARGLNGRRVAQLQRIGQDEDFPGTNTFKESYLAGLWVKFL
jgi:23S rRNA (cytosine1962-C5)-methyltransferase